MSQIFPFHLSLVSIPIFLIIPIYLLFKRFKVQTRSHSYNLPPGPWKLPIIGNLHQLAFSSSLPHRSLRDLAAKYGPVMALRFGEVFTVVVSSKESAREFLQTHELVFAQRPVTLGMEAMSFAPRAGFVASPYGDYWRKTRRVCVAGIWSPKRVESFGPAREEESLRLVESVRDSASRGETVNLSRLILSTVIGTVSRAVYGKRSRSHDEYVALLDEVLTLSTGFTLADCFPSVKVMGSLTRMSSKLERIKKRMSDILEDIVYERKMKGKSLGAEEEKKDILDVLLELQQSNEFEFELTTNHIKTLIMDIVGAGGETTATALVWAMSEIVTNQRVLEKAQLEVRNILQGKTTIKEADIQELDYLRCIIKETLRLHPPAPLLGRESRENCNVSGFDIPYKAKIVINAWALGRDSNIWGPNAECFEPERFMGSTHADFKGTDFEFLPFGAGRRICPGISFSLPNMELVLASLLYHFDWSHPNGGELKGLDMCEEYKISCRRKYDLCLIAIPVIP